jgi:hypothetical protein
MSPHLQLLPDHILEAIQHQATQQAEEGQRKAEGAHEAIAKTCSMVSIGSSISDVDVNSAAWALQLSRCLICSTEQQLLSTTLTWCVRVADTRPKR